MPEHKFHVISTDKTVADDFGKKGYREYLLCETCEGRSGEWDDYASKVFFGDVAKPMARGQKTIRFAKVGYKIFKLFLMSLLWRMHAAEGELFSQVDLGQKHGERIRQALIAGDPLDQDDYPCLIVAVLIDGKMYHDWILQPDVARADGYRWYRFVVCGYLFNFAVSSHSLPKGVSEFSLTTRDELVVSIEDIRQIHFLKDVACRFGEAQRTPAQLKRRKRSIQSVPIRKPTS